MARSSRGRFWFLYPGIRLKRWALLFVVGTVILATGMSGLLGQMFSGIHLEILPVQDLIDRMKKLVFVDLLMIVLALWAIVIAVRRGFVSAVMVLAPPGKVRRALSLVGRDLKKRRGPRIVVIGGGTGMPNTILGLKIYTSNLSAVVTVADDGGSSGRLRKDFKMLPPGDISNCLVALAGSDSLLQKLFQHRFGRRGDLSGYRFGNLFLAAMSEVTGDFSEAIKESSRVLAIEGEVIPVTYNKNMVLRAKLEDGRMVEGQSRIEFSRKISRLSLRGKAPQPSPEAVRAIRSSDAVILGPGSLYTSVLPNLLVRGITNEIKSFRGRKIYVCNIMTQPGETEDFTVSQHVQTLLNHAGKGFLDTVVVNTGIIPSAMLKKYAREGSVPVLYDKENLTGLGISVVEADVVRTDSFIRHDPRKLAKVLIRMILV